LVFCSITFNKTINRENSKSNNNKLNKKLNNQMLIPNRFSKVNLININHWKTTHFFYFIKITELEECAI